MRLCSYLFAFLQKEEELERLQAELHSLLAGVTAARHEQQQQQCLLAQLHHQHEDSTQVTYYYQCYILLHKLLSHIVTYCYLLHCCTPPCHGYIAVSLHVIIALLH